MQILLHRLLCYGILSLTNHDVLLYLSPMSPEGQYRRTQYLVDRGYQLRFVTRIFLVMLAIAVVACLLGTGLLWKNMYEPNPEQQEIFVAALIAMALTLLIILVLTIPIALFLSIRHTHSIVGPMKRLQKTLEAIGNGDFSQRIVLRDGDALEDIARAINKMAEKLKEKP